MSDIVFSSAKNSSLIAHKVKTGKLIRLGEGIYSGDLSTPIAQQIHENLADIFSYLKIEGALCWESGLKRPADLAGQDILLQGSKPRNVNLEAGVTITVFPTKDYEIAHRSSFQGCTGVLAPSIYRAILENLSEGKVAQRRSDPDLAISHLRTHLRVIEAGNPRGLAADFKVFQDLAQVLGLSDSLKAVTSEFSCAFARVASASISHAPVDTKRIELFELAAEKLESTLGARPANNVSRSAAQRDRLAFLESYFSNYIEGTEFEVDEAARIIYEPEYQDRMTRNKDGHDISSLYAIAKEAPIKLETTADYIRAVKQWNEKLMSHRFVGAGQFKTEFNRAGNTRFVAPELLHATLSAGFDLARDLTPGLARAALLKLVFIECHPFNDGNGRTSRILLNNELDNEGQDRIIIPTVFRDDYITALKAFSQSSNPIPYQRMINRAALINESIPKEADNLGVIIEFLREKSAFCHSTDSIWGVSPPVQADHNAQEENSFGGLTFS